MSLSELDELIYYTNIKLAEEIVSKDPKYLILNYKELLYITFTRKDHTSLPANVLKGQSKDS